ncbi:MAG: hypothetical protein U0M42_01380 [Acutalibacteraceae bacterium]|nr:hypothetical protein [Acutalibacteraceae bacterium]
MNELDKKWKDFTLSGKITDYLDYCSVKEGNGFEQNKTVAVQRCAGGKRNECR